MLDSAPCLPLHDHVSAIFQLGRSIQAKVLVLTEDEVLLHQVHHACHLEVDENLVVASLELMKQAIETRKFG